jgi:hypothetical protein
MHTKVYSENLKRLKRMWSQPIKISLEHLWREGLDIIHLAHWFATSICAPLKVGQYDQLVERLLAFINRVFYTHIRLLSLEQRYFLN